MLYSDAKMTPRPRRIATATTTTRPGSGTCKAVVMIKVG